MGRRRRRRHRGNRNQHAHAHTDQLQRKEWRHTLILFLICTLFCGIIALFVLNRFYFLPPAIGNFISDVEALIQAAGAIIGIFIAAFTIVWKNARRLQAIGVSILLVVLLVGVYLFLPGNISGNPRPPQEPNWLHHYSWMLPYCNDREEWMIALPGGTSVDCSHQTFLMRQEQHTLPTLYYAEVNLFKIKGEATYNQTAFEFTSTITFTNPNDVDTNAVVVVQTPSDQEGGFGLAVNPDGICQGQRYGKARMEMRFPCKRAEVHSATMTLTVMVLNQMFYGLIDGNPVISVPDTLQSGQVGFMVELTGQRVPSSPIQFSNANLYTL
jgi:hypothetical protein